MTNDDPTQPGDDEEEYGCLEKIGCSLSRARTPFGGTVMFVATPRTGLLQRPAVGSNQLDPATLTPGAWFSVAAPRPELGCVGRPVLQQYFDRSSQGFLAKPLICNWPER